MKPSEIKNRIIAYLNSITIDDFYALNSLDFAKEIFYKMTGLSSEEQIEQYLLEQFPATTQFSSIFRTEEEIKSVQEQTENEAAVIENIKEQLKTYEQKSIEYNGLISGQEEDYKKCEEEIKVLNNLYNDYRSRELSSDFSKHIQNIEFSKEETQSKAARILDSIQNAKIENDNLAIRQQLLIEELATKEASHITTLSTLEGLKGKLEEIYNPEPTYSQEYEALVLLFLLLLKKKTYTRNVEKYLETGKLVKDEYNSKMVPEMVLKKTGEELHIYEDKKANEELFPLLIEYTKNQKILPEDWRQVLYRLLSGPIPAFSGIISKIDKDKDFCIEHKNTWLTKEDLSLLLAVKTAVKSRNSLLTEENKIILGLSGGIMAIITFRLKGEIIMARQTKPTEFYINLLKNPSQYSWHTLYKQHGYADTDLDILLPNAYYILTKDYVIELEFMAAPALFDSNSLIRNTPSISSKSKKDDETAALEEEERRRQEDDDWDD